MATGSGTTFTVTAPVGCPNSAASSSNLEVDVNPYFVQFINGNSISLSATPGGSTITLTNGGSGTHHREHAWIRSPSLDWRSSPPEAEPRRMTR